MKRNRLAIASLTLATFLSFANAQQAQFKDVPAGHWAKQAVEFITQCGLIEGFPDGTFRGNQNLTRYQAALIFFRYIQNGSKACPGMEAEAAPAQATVQAGMDEVRKELDDLKTRFDAMEKTTQDHTARLAQLEADVKRAIEVSQRATELEQRIVKLEDQLTQVQKAQETQAQQPAPAPAPAPAATGPSPQELQARLDALEVQVKQLAQAPATPSAPQDISGLERRLSALEEQVKNLPSAARVAALEDQVKTLNTQVNTLNTQVSTLQGQVTDLRQAQQPAPQPQAQQPAQPAPQPQPDLKPVTPTPAPAPRARNFYIGAGASLGNALDSTSSLNAGGFVGLRNVFLGMGIRAGVDFSLSSSASNAQVFLTRDLNAGGGFNPYLGLGTTISLSGGNAIYGTGLVGFDLNLLGPVGIFAEATPGFGPNTSFSLGARAGLKFNF